MTVVSSPVVDKTYDRLINYMYGQYPESHPLSDPLAAPRCAFEEYFVVSDPQGSARRKLHVYPRVEELVCQTQDHAVKLAREPKLLHRILPLKRRSFSVADDPDFIRLTGNKSIAKARAGSMSFADMEKIEKCSCTFLEGYSQSFWLLSALLSQLKQDGFKPFDPALFDKTISSLSAALASQTSLAAGLADFVVSKWRESYLAHVSLSFVRDSWVGNIAF